MSEVALFPPDAPVVQRFLSLLRGEDTITVEIFQMGPTTGKLYEVRPDAGENAVAAMVFFGGDRFTCVEWVALAFEPLGGNGESKEGAGQMAVDQLPVGIATLAPTDEEGEDGPHIIGVYVLAPHRGKEHELTLVRRLVEESQKHYRRVPKFVPITPYGQEVAQEAIAHGVPLELSLR